MEPANQEPDHITKLTQRTYGRRYLGVPANAVGNPKVAIYCREALQSALENDPVLEFKMQLDPINLKAI